MVQVAPKGFLVNSNKYSFVLNIILKNHIRIWKRCMVLHTDIVFYSNSRFQIIAKFVKE
jgi:hypothetical protein